MKITEEMVERACKVLCEASSGSLFPKISEMRAALEAALTEPEEIPVSPAMLVAGAEASCEHTCKIGEEHIPAKFCEESMVWDIYRAMEAKRREEQGPSAAPYGAECQHDWRVVAAFGGSNSRGGQTLGCAKCRTSRTVLNERRSRSRRKDDPK